MLVIPSSAWSLLFAFFLVASLRCLMLSTMGERPHLSRIRGCVCWCPICRDLTTCYSSTIWTMQWLVQRNPSSLMSKSRKTFLYADVHVMCWLPSGRLNASRLQNVPKEDEQVPPHHQLVSLKSSCPLSVNRLYRTERCAPAGLPTKIALAAHQTHFKKHARGVKRCVASALVCGNQCCNCGAILASRACLLNTSQRFRATEVFCRASLAKGSPTQRIVEILSDVFFSLWWAVVRKWYGTCSHGCTSSHIFSHMAIWSSNHLCLRVPLLFSQQRI